MTTLPAVQTNGIKQSRRLIGFSQHTEDLEVHHVKVK
jgi:hypothetical protein